MHSEETSILFWFETVNKQICLQIIMTYTFHLIGVHMACIPDDRLWTVSGPGVPLTVN
jgi:hypothetical protein